MDSAKSPGEEKAQLLERPDSDKEHCWTVYLLTCADDSLYCGITTDIVRRMAMHNGVISGGARYTRGRRPVKLSARADGLTRSEALRLEAKIKKLPRSMKIMALTAESHQSTALFREKRKGGTGTAPCRDEA